MVDLVHYIKNENNPIKYATRNVCLDIWLEQPEERTI